MTAPEVRVPQDGSPEGGTPENGTPPGQAFARRAAAACAVGLVTVAALGVALRGPTIPGLDRWLHDVVIRRRGGDLLTVARGMTEGGSTFVVWPLLVVAAITFPRTRGPRAWVGSLAVGALVGLGIGVRLWISLLVHRVRPPASDWAMTAGGYAFPSGHTTAATLAAGFLAWAISRHLPDRRGRFAVWALAVGFAVLVGWTRVWLGVHWPLDVVGGWILGSSWLAGIAAVVAVVERRFGGWVDE